MNRIDKNLAPKAARFKDGFYTVRDGLRLHFRDYPGPIDRPPLLCLPGLTRNARDFEAFAERWSPRFRVIAVEFRGRGESDRDPDPSRYMPVTYAHDTIALLDHLGVADAIFVGTSLGGLVTMLMTALDEDRIAASIINDVGPELEEGGLERIRAYVRTYVSKDRGFADWDEIASVVVASGRGLPRHYGREDWLRAVRRLASLKDGVIRFDYDVAIAQPFETSAPTPQADMWPLFRALAKRPLLLIRGAESDLLGDKTFARMIEQAPGAAFVEVPGVGHAPDLEEPAAVAAVEAFLDRVAPLTQG